MTEQPKQGLAAFFGTWPGDETDEELLQSVADLDSPWLPISDHRWMHHRKVLVAGREDCYIMWTDKVTKGSIAQNGITHWTTLPKMPTRVT